MSEYMTPITKLGFFGDNEVFLKREDLLPVAFGGNKVRIAREFIDDMQARGGNCMIGYGSSRSNMCRALAILCDREEIPCHIIFSSDDGEEYDVSWNSLIIDSTHAIIHHCDKLSVAQTVENVLEETRHAGFDPYYIFGDKYGKNNEVTPVRAYEKAYSEILAQQEELGLKFDQVFLPVGTAMTISGLLAGQLRNNVENQRVIGISIARSAERVQEIINSTLNKVFPVHTENIDYQIIDKYLNGGYAKYNTSILKTMRYMMCHKGIATDPVYTGKAFDGMLHYLDENDVHGQKVLFILTGGVPLFFDYAQQALH